MNPPVAPPRWNLQDLLGGADVPTLDRYLGELEASVLAIESARKNLTAEIPSAEFLDLVRQYETMSQLMSRLGAYSYLWYAEDTQNPAALNLRGRLEQVLTEAGNRVLFFSLWFKELPAAAAARLLAASGDVRYYLESLRRLKPYTLSEAVEQVINLKDVNGRNALVNVYEVITNRFSFSLEVDGEQLTLTRDQLSSYFRHPAPEVRAAAYQMLYQVYGDNATLLAQIYAHLVRDGHAEALGLRGYAQPISARNLGNDLPDAVVDALLASCRQNARLFQRYFRIKARWLGLDQLRRYDIYAPLARSEKAYDYAQAVDLVLSTLRDFSPLLAEQAERVIVQQHLDAEVRPGKRGGAFCYGVLPELTPWVLVNYTGRPRDVATLAHELGHALHSMQAAAHSVLTFHASQPLAETASVFAEQLLASRLLHEERDPAVRRDLLVDTLDDVYATVLRQAYFTLFERDAYQMLADGKSFDDLAAHYLENLREQFGDAVELSDEFKWEWVSIPHFFASPFYTYSYSFGQLLVLALYQRYRSEGEAFIPKYMRILAHGGAEAPAIILKEAGIDIASPAFWQGGFDMIRELIQQLESIG